MEKNMVAMKASAHLSHMVLTACAKIKDGTACKQQLQRLWELGWVVQAEDANIAVALVRVFLTYLMVPYSHPAPSRGPGCRGGRVGGGCRSAQ